MDTFTTENINKLIGTCTNIKGTLTKHTNGVLSSEQAAALEHFLKAFLANPIVADSGLVAEQWERPSWGSVCDQG